MEWILLEVFLHGKSTAAEELGLNFSEVLLNSKIKSIDYFFSISYLFWIAPCLSNMQYYTLDIYCRGWLWKVNCMPESERLFAGKGHPVIFQIRHWQTPPQRYFQAEASWQAHNFHHHYLYLSLSPGFVIALRKGSFYINTISICHGSVNLSRITHSY